MPSKAKPERPSWDVDDLRGFLAGTADRKLLSEVDRIGLSPVAFAALQGAAASDALLSLLYPKTPEDEDDPVADIRELLVALGQSVQRLEKKIDRLTKARGAVGS